MRNDNTLARVAVIKTDGVNCDAETLFAFQQAGAQGRIVHINQLRAGLENLAGYDIVAFAGGFSYGDDIASGRVLANELLSHLAEQLGEFVGRPHTLVLGVCNGFQVLVRCGLLPFGRLGEMRATLAHNESGRFECRWVNLLVPDSPCVFTRGFRGEICLPVAHGEGNFQASQGVLEEIESQRLVAVRYSLAGSPTQVYPANPNGSTGAIAGVCDPTGRIFGLMPHPERFVVSSQHPNWRRGRIQPHGRAMFANAVRYVLETR